MAADTAAWAAMRRLMGAARVRPVRRPHILQLPPDRDTFSSWHPAVDVRAALVCASTLTGSITNLQGRRSFAGCSSSPYTSSLALDTSH